MAQGRVVAAIEQSGVAAGVGRGESGERSSSSSSTSAPLSSSRGGAGLAPLELSARSRCCSAARTLLQLSARRRHSTPHSLGALTAPVRLHTAALHLRRRSTSSSPTSTPLNTHQRLSEHGRGDRGTRARALHRVRPLPLCPLRAHEPLLTPSFLVLLPCLFRRCRPLPRSSLPMCSALLCVGPSQRHDWHAQDGEGRLRSSPWLPREQVRRPLSLCRHRLYVVRRATIPRRELRGGRVRVVRRSAEPHR